MINGLSSLDIKSGFTRDDLRRLASEGDGWRLSLYMPLHRTGREVRQSPILLKDLRARAQADLEARGCDPGTIGELLAPVDRILGETGLSLLQGEGLAVLSARDHSESFLMPIAPPASASVGKRFLLDPLLPVLFEDGRFHLLALSLNSVRLYESDRLRLREIPLEGVATNMREALRFEDVEPQLIFQSGSQPTGRQAGPGIFHGHGGGRTDQKDRKRDILEFFRQVDQGVRSRLREADLPLMLAGVDSLIPVYREANSHPRLLDDTVPGNPEALLRQDEIHARAWDTYRAFREREKKAVLRTYGERLASPEAAAGLGAVLPAARDRRILHLFLRRGYRQWGRFDPDRERLDLRDGPGPDAEELANLACTGTLLGGGRVYLTDAGEIPEGSEIAALCRY